MPVTRILCGLLLWLNAGVALALDILLTNDDGFETANVRALYQRLKAAGHDVVISAPVHNHSGGGGNEGGTHGSPPGGWADTRTACDAQHACYP
jgi:5'-nucleotidase